MCVRRSARAPPVERWCRGERPSTLPASSVRAPFVGDVVAVEQVLAPFGARLRVATEQHVFESDAQSRLRREQRHPRLFGRAAALARVAGDAGRREVFGRRATGARAWRDVVERQFARAPFLSAIPAAETVARAKRRTNLERRAGSPPPSPQGISVAKQQKRERARGFPRGSRPAPTSLYECFRDLGARGRSRCVNYEAVGDPVAARLRVGTRAPA
jgi:hypothetical protein